MGRKLTYANVVATLALIIAVGCASAFAATQLAKNSVGSKQLKKNAVTTAKIKNGAVTGAKIKVSTLPKVPSATRADHAVSAETATGAGTAVNATNAANAQPVAFARVSSDGVLDRANSKNVGKVTVNTMSAHIYCFSGLPFAPKGGVATVDSTESSTQYAQFALGTAEGCPGDTVAYVFTLEATTPATAGFFVVFYG